jgi:hypothetical protein
MWLAILFTVAVFIIGYALGFEHAKGKYRDWFKE